MRRKEEESRRLEREYRRGVIRGVAGSEGYVGPGGGGRIRVRFASAKGGLDNAVTKVIT